MAKKSKSRRGRASLPERYREPMSFVSVTPSRLDLRLLEDRRLYHPLGAFAPPKSHIHRVGRIAPVDRRSSSPAQRDAFGDRVRSQTKAPLTFQAPQAVALCVRRQRRKEVIFATGKGGGSHKRPKRNAWSSISCKR